MNKCVLADQVMKCKILCDNGLPILPVVFDEQSERLKFEKWAYETEHHPYGWLGFEWFSRGSARAAGSYDNEYVHGLWQGWKACSKSRCTQ